MYVDVLDVHVVRHGAPGGYSQRSKANTKT